MWTEMVPPVQTNILKLLISISLLYSFMGTVLIIIHNLVIGQLIHHIMLFSN